MDRQLDEISEKEILSGKEKRRIAEELLVSPGIYGALLIAALLLLGLTWFGAAGWPTGGNSLSATADTVPLSPRATVAARFYFDAAAKRQM
jgi:hypothetical protein